MSNDLKIQIERRRQRALEEIDKVVNRGAHPVFSVFAVTSRSGRTYQVEIRALDELTNTCDCPDYRTNLIGTCKHIEGVLLYLRKTHRARLGELARRRPAGTQVFLHYGEEVSVRAGLPLPRRRPVRELLESHFGPDGVLLGAPLRALPRLFDGLEALAPRDRALVTVGPAVREHLALLQDRQSVARQKAWFLQQIERGARSFDVLRVKLYPYQEQGALHLAFGGRALLADDMGLCKTIEALAATVLLKDLRDVQRALIVCPASLKHQWAREIRRFTELPAIVVSGGLAARRAAYQEPGFFKIVNYEIVRRDLPELEALHPDLIILDEAQRIKNWRTKTAMVVKQLRSRYAFVLTGTPLENRLDELYSIFQFIDPRILGPLWRFNQRFFETEQQPSGAFKVLGYKNLGELRATVGPYVVRRTRDEVLHDLPERVDNHFFVEMTDPQWRAYDEYRETVARLVNKAKRRPLTPKEREILMLCLIKMRIICDALALHDKTIPLRDREKTAPKLRELGVILEDQVASNGHKALVFSQWSGMLALTEPIIKRTGLGYVKLTGDVPSARRGALIERFFDDPRCKVFLSTDAGGVGLNLQAASLVVNLDLPWNPAVLEQRIARAHRHGQSSSVHVINLVAKGTIEERMLDTLAKKRTIFAGIFGAEETPDAIHFEDTGQAALIKQLDALLGEPGDHAPELALEPVVTVAAGPARPTLEGFAGRLLERLPGRVLLVRRAPDGQGVLVVVEGAPVEARSVVGAILSDYFGADAPVLHLMDPEGYRALAAFLPAAAFAPEQEAYRAREAFAPEVDAQRAARAARRARAAAALAQANRRLTLATVLRDGGFPEELLRPAREALGWGLSALLALHGEHEPAAELPAPRLVEAELVAPGRLPAELAARLARVRELSEPPASGIALPPPSAETGAALLSALQALAALAQQQLAGA
jgi:superfamily II DNA or RNA helicase